MTCTKRHLKSEKHKMLEFAVKIESDGRNSVEGCEENCPWLVETLLKTEPTSDDDSFKQSNDLDGHNQCTDECFEVNNQEPVCNTSTVQQISPMIQVENIQTEPHSFEQISKKTDGVECDICGQKLSWLRNLKTHKILKHSSPDTIFCNHCARVFSNVEERDVHWRECVLKGRLRKSKVTIKRRKTSHESDSNSSNSLWCRLCRLEFQTDNDLHEHMQIHLAEIEMFKCTQCYAIFGKKSSLKVHNCQETTSDKFFCNSCNEAFASIKERNNHKMECCIKMAKNVRRFEIGDEFECYLCKRKIKRLSDLRRHMRGKHDPNADKFTCKYCKKIFMMETSLQSHLCRGITKGTPHERSFECYLCKSKMKLLASLQRHMRGKHHPDADKFKCTLCSKSFMVESSLQSHQCRRITKNSPKLVPCDFCGKIMNKGSLYYHRIKRHSPAGTIICRFCPKRFATIELLKAHEPQCSSRSRVQHTCERCGKILSCRRTYLRHNISFHSKPGTIFCKICIRKFETKEELKIHWDKCSAKDRLRRLKRK